MSPHHLFQMESIGRNQKNKEESEMGENDHTILEREVADIIIHLLHRQDSVLTDRGFDRRSSETIGFDLGFPKWNGKRKRSVHASATLPASHVGEPIISVSSSDAPMTNIEDRVGIESRASCPNLMQGYFKSGIPEYEQRGIRFWAEWRGGRGEFLVPDLNVSAEDLMEMRRRQQEEVYATACRRLAAADARRKRKELQRLKNSIAADAPLCSRVR